MKGFETLEGLVNDGSARLIQITSVPRSVSTMVGRTLNEADGALFINEPFNRRVSGADQAAELILQHVMPIAEGAEDTLTIVTKNMASYVPREDLKKFTSIAEAHIWTIRQPLVQLGSLITRLVNDIHVERGANAIDQNNLDLYIDEAVDYLDSSEKSRGFSKTGWSSIGGHFQDRADDETTVVLDADTLVDNPYVTIMQLCRAVGLEYNPNMVNDWQCDYVNACNGDDKAETARSAWTYDVANSSHISRLRRKPLDYSRIPDTLRVHLDEVAQPVYNHMLSFVGTHSEAELTA